MDEERKRKILNGGWRAIAPQRLAEAILQGEFQLTDLVTSTERDKQILSDIEKMLKTRLDKVWEEVVRSQNIERYREYIARYGNTNEHVREAREWLNQKDQQVWQEQVLEKLKNRNPEQTKSGIANYKTLFPDGIYFNDCNEIENDLDWAFAKQRNTIAGFEEYRRSHPGEHEREIEEFIFKIRDEQAWERARKGNRIADYLEYINSFLTGTHVKEAKDRIDHPSDKDRFLEEIKKDPNKYSADEINKQIENTAGLTYNDLVEVFTEQQVAAIRSYRSPGQLVTVRDHGKLPRGYTEVYFWGLRGTGKTCAIGATIGYLSNVRKSLRPNHENSTEVNAYIQQLQFLFNQGGAICMLPPGTVTGNLPAMSFAFDEIKTSKSQKIPKEHRVTLVDVAGEVFSGIYKQRVGLNVTREESEAINRLKKCLKDKYNNKIHFFIVEYGDDGNVEFPNYGTINKSQVMQSLAGFFAQERIFNDSAVSLNILVTKCDRIREGDRMEEVKKYVANSGWSVAVNGINSISIDARTGCLYGMGFSIGEVFAKDLCIFNPDDAEAIVKEIEERTPGISRTWWGRFIDGLRQ